MVEQLSLDTENPVRRIDFKHKAGRDVPFRRIYLFDPDKQLDWMRKAYAPFFAFPLKRWALDLSELWYRMERTEAITLPDHTELHGDQKDIKEIMNENDHVAVPFSARGRLKKTKNQTYRGHIRNDTAFGKIAVRIDGYAPPYSPYRGRVSLREYERSELRKTDDRLGEYNEKLRYRGATDGSPLRNRSFFRKFSLLSMDGRKPRPLIIKHYQWDNDTLPAFPEATYLVDEKQIHDPVCDACPRQHLHQLGRCQLGDAVCHAQLKEFFAGDFFGNLAQYEGYVDENYDIIEKCKQEGEDETEESRQ